MSDTLLIKDLPITTSVLMSNKIMVLTDLENNYIQNIDISNFNSSIISNETNNIVTTDINGKIYADNSAVNNIIGDLNNLTTSDKTSVVNAVNSVKSDITYIRTNYPDNDAVNCYYSKILDIRSAMANNGRINPVVYDSVNNKNYMCDIFICIPTSSLTLDFSEAEYFAEQNPDYYENLFKFTTFEICLIMHTVQSITFPDNVVWLDNEAPDLSEAGVYFLVFRTVDKGTYWIGNLQGKANIATAFPLNGGS